MVILPNTLTYSGINWTLLEGSGDGVFTVDYIGDDAFPVSFAEQTVDGARALMLTWLQAEGLM